MLRVIHFEIPWTIPTVPRNSTHGLRLEVLINGRAGMIIGSLLPERESYASMAGCCGVPIPVLGRLILSA